MLSSKAYFSIFFYFASFLVSNAVFATIITVTEGANPSALIGSVLNKTGSNLSHAYQAYDTTDNIALNANTTVNGTIGGYSNIHDADFITDGYFGNGSSWIGDQQNIPWLQIDLGSVFNIGQIVFGRDQLGGFGDRDSGRFYIDFAQTNGIFNNVVDSSSLSFSGQTNPQRSVQIDFQGASITAQFIRMRFTNLDTAIDEVQVFAAQVPEPASLFLFGLGFFGIVLTKSRKRNHQG